MLCKRRFFFFLLCFALLDLHMYVCMYVCRSFVGVSEYWMAGNFSPYHETSGVIKGEGRALTRIAPL